MKKIEEKYKIGQISKFVKAICVDNNLDYNVVATKLLISFPELKNKKKCVNCNASMAIREHSIDVIDTLLLVGMHKVIFHKVSKGMPFFEANQVHVQQELGDYYSVKSRTSWCRELGLVAKVIQKGKNTQKAGTWCITKRGFAYLTNQPVPKKVSTFRNKIYQRYPETTTIQEVMENNIKSTRSKGFMDYKNINVEQTQYYANVGFSQGNLSLNN